MVEEMVKDNYVICEKEKTVIKEGILLKLIKLCHCTVKNNVCIV